MDWTQIIISLITLVIAPCAIAVTKSIVSLLAAKTKDARLQAVIADVGTAVSTAVDSLSQTVVEGLKAQSADGKLTEEDAKKILNEAASKAESMISATTIAFVQEQGKDISEYLVDKIEAYIATKKGV